MHFNKLAAKGEENDTKNNRMLIHCAMGKSRSATAFIMYVMRRFGLNMDDAFEFCHSQR